MLEKHPKFGFEMVSSVALKGVASLTLNLPSERGQFAEDDSASRKSAI